MDLFADALVCNLTCGDIKQSSPSVAPSQGLPTRPSQGVLRRMRAHVDAEDVVATVLDSDDENPQLPITMGDPACADAFAHSLAAQSLDCKSGVSSTPPPCKRRCLPGLQFKLIEVPAADAMDICCIFVDHGKIRVPVPLWGQYTVTWKGGDLEQSRWILVSNYERWVDALVDNITNTSRRKIGKSFIDRVRNEFLKCMETARSPNRPIEDAFEKTTGDTPPAPSTNALEATKLQWRQRAKNRTNSPSMAVNIGAFRVMCLNDAKKIVLRLDEETIKFIKEWMVPLLRETARSQDELDRGSVRASVEAPAKLATFHFSAPTTPNIRDKVLWNPTTHSWQILLRKNKAVPSDTFTVDPCLDKQSYDEQKGAAYCRAIETWNELDGTSRFRIPTRSLSDGKAC